MKSITVIEAPSNLGLKPPTVGKVPGVYRFPEAIRGTDLYSRLAIDEIMRVDAPDYSPEPNPETGIRNAQAIREYARRLSRVIEQTLGNARFPLVIGGDCSILLGATLALRRMGRYGLLFVDGHTDFQTPETSATGGAAGMDLALVTGYGPELLTKIDNFHPLIDERDVVAFGFRDIENPAIYPARLIYDTQVQRFDLARVRELGIERAMEACLNHFRRQNVAGIWMHLDVDALDDAIMPAVDSRQPDGLSYDELSAIIRLLVQSGLFTGLQITIYDPDLDPDGVYLQAFARHLSICLSGY